MSFWTAIVIVVCAVMIVEIYRIRSGKSSPNSHSGKDDLPPAVAQRLQQIEQRIGNLETVLLENEKERRFRELEK